MTVSPSRAAPSTALWAASGGGRNRNPAARLAAIASSSSCDLPLKANGPTVSVSAGSSSLMTGGPAHSAIGALQPAGGLAFGVQSGNGARLIYSNQQQ